MSLLQERIYSGFHLDRGQIDFWVHRLLTKIKIWCPQCACKPLYQDKPRSCHQINSNFDHAEQKIVKLLAKWGGNFFESTSKYGYQEVNYYFKGCGAIFLYYFLRVIQPKSLVEDRYPLDWYVNEKRFWNEQYFLENFLRFNPVFTVEMPIYYLIKKSTFIIEAYNSICKYQDFQPSGYSFYMQRL